MTRDHAVSPVIGVVLMVLITVVLAGVVYVWASGFQPTQTQGPGTYAVTAKTHNLDGDANTEWIGLTLTSAPQPVTPQQARFDVTTGNQTTTTACERPDTEDGLCSAPFDGGDTWDAGTRLWVPCQTQGPHAITVSIHGQTVLDTTLTCGGPA